MEEGRRIKEGSYRNREKATRNHA